MKATGIVRKVDELGRIVIPKEMRKTLRIKDGTPMEIFTDKRGEIVLKKYSPIGELSLWAKEYTETLAQVTGMLACITDRDQVIAAFGQEGVELEGKGITEELENVILEGETKCFRSGARDRVMISESYKNFGGSEIIQPILCNGTSIGSVILMNKSKDENMGESEKMLVQTAAGFLGKQMEQ